MGVETDKYPWWLAQGYCHWGCNNINNSIEYCVLTSYSHIVSWLHTAIQHMWDGLFGGCIVHNDKCNPMGSKVSWGCCTEVAAIYLTTLTLRLLLSLFPSHVLPLMQVCIHIKCTSCSWNLNKTAIFISVKESAMKRKLAVVPYDWLFISSVLCIHKYSYMIFAEVWLRALYLNPFSGNKKKS